MEEGELVPLLIAAGGGGNAYLEDPESSLDQIPLEQYENSNIAPSTNGRTGAAGTIFMYEFWDTVPVFEITQRNKGEWNFICGAHSTENNFWKS